MAQYKPATPATNTNTPKTVAVEAKPSPMTAKGVSVPEPATMPAKTTPKSDSPTIKPVESSTPRRLAASGREVVSAQRL